MSRQARPRERVPDAEGIVVPRGLVYTSDDKPGIQRLRKGEAFIYRAVDGKHLRDAAELKRIRSLAIPPAYEGVWICPLPHGHLQATGRDARGRKQYRYHPEWRTARDADKFEHMLAFGRALPKIRRQVKAHLAAPMNTAPGRDAVLATIVRLLDTTLVRVGNDEYARTNGSFGLTTLRNRHVAVVGNELRLHFRGKSGVTHEVSVDDPRVARIVRRCQAMPGQELFQYVADGVRRTIDSADVNEYLGVASGDHFTAKDFRTWHGTVHALDLLLLESEIAPTARRSANLLIGEVAKRLGNTVAVCKKAYIHPTVLAAMATTSDEKIVIEPARRAGLDTAERRLLTFLADSR